MNMGNSLRLEMKRQNGFNIQWLVMRVENNDKRSNGPVNLKAVTLTLAYASKFQV